MQNLIRLLPQKNAQQFLKDITQVVAILKDVKSKLLSILNLHHSDICFTTAHQWQKRTKSLEKIKMIFFMTVDFIENDPDIVESVMNSCPMLVSSKMQSNPP